MDIQNNQSKLANAAVNTQKENNANTQFCFTTHISKYQVLSNWALDSGATKHIGNKNTPLKNIKSLKYSVKIKVVKSSL